MSNLESKTDQCEAATIGSQYEIVEMLDEGKQPHKEEIRVDIAGPSRLLPKQYPNLRPLRSAQNQISCDDRRRAEYLKIGVPLYQAAMIGDWKAAKTIIDNQEDIVTATISNNLEIALHIAVAAKHKRFVRNLLGKMSSDDLALQNKHNNTALCFAAATGIIKIAEMLIDMNPDLPMIRGGGEMTPVHVAALFGHGEMVKFLYGKTDIDRLSDAEFINLFLAIISADIYDVALRMLRKKEKLAISRNDSTRETALHLMARKPSAISHKRQLNLFQSAANSIFKGFFCGAKMQTLAHQLVEELWKSVVQLPVGKLWEFLGSPSRLLFDAAESGNVEFLVILIRSYPDLIWKVDDMNRSLFHVAALNRHESIFDIIYELGAIKDLIVAYKEDTSKNNLLHLVARLPSPDRLQVVTGAALQMQREILWFKAVKKIVPRSYIKAKNSDGEVAHDLFTKEHNKLRKEGEIWMKSTATSCMLVATLIATVVFAAGFTVPGDYDNAGYPKFRKKFWFDMFMLSNSVALFSSVTSIVIFLSILTSRYAEDDFRTALPSKLMFGLLALFASIISMVLAFTATMILTHYEEPKYSLILIVCLASLTALSFVTLHIHLWYDTLRSCLLKFLFQRRKSGLFA